MIMKQSRAGRSKKPEQGTVPQEWPFEGEIRAFEARDRRAPPPAGAVVCTGSSTVRGWHRMIRRDLAPLTVIPRGFGGSRMCDLLHYVGRVVLPYRPRAVVIYEGDNDIGSGQSPQAVLDGFRALVRRLRGRLPGVRLYVLAIKPSPCRWALWPRMQAANALLVRACRRDPRFLFVDVATPMLGADGRPRPDLYLADGLHMTRKGYRVWRDVVRPVLLARELRQEGARRPRRPGPA
jgi:lysophospholipase L1-like esterase